MSLGESGTVLEAGKGFSLFPPSGYDPQQKTVLGTAEDLITVNWAGVGVGIFVLIMGLMFLINLIPMLNSLASWIPSFRRQSSGGSYGGWEDSYGGTQGGLTERYDVQ